MEKRLEISDKPKIVLKIIEQLENNKMAFHEERNKKQEIKNIIKKKEELQRKLKKVNDDMDILANPSFVHSKLEISISSPLFHTGIGDNLSKDRLKQLKTAGTVLQEKINYLDKQIEVLKKDLERQPISLEEFTKNFIEDTKAAKVKMTVIEGDWQVRENRRKQEVDRLNKLAEEQRLQQEKEIEERNKRNVKEAEEIRAKQKERHLSMEKRVLTMKELEDFKLEKRKVKLDSNARDEKRQELIKLKKRDEVYKIYTNRQLPNIPDKMKENVTKELIEARKLKLREIQNEPLKFQSSATHKEYLEKVEEISNQKYNEIYNLNMKKNLGNQLKEIALTKMEIDSRKVKELQDRVAKLEAPPLGKADRETREEHFKRKLFDKIKLGKLSEDDLERKYKWPVNLKKSADFIKQSIPVEEPENKERMKSSRIRTKQFIDKLSKKKFYDIQEKQEWLPVDKVEDYLKNLREKRALHPVLVKIEGITLIRQTKMARQIGKVRK